MSLCGCVSSLVAYLGKKKVGAGLGLAGVIKILGQNILLSLHNQL